MDEYFTRVFQITNRCVNRCQMCPIWRLPSNDVSVEEFEREVEKLERDSSRARKAYLVFSGGEPLLHPQFPSLWKIGAKFRMRISHPTQERGIAMISTLNFDPERLKKSLRDFFFDEVFVSIHGFREDHDKYLDRPGAFEKAVKNLTWLVKSRRVERVGFNSCIMKETLSEKYYRFLELANEKLNLVFVTLINPQKYEKKPIFLSLRETLNALGEAIERISRLRLNWIQLQGVPPCYFGKNGIDPSFLEKAYIIGDRKTSLRSTSGEYGSCRLESFLDECRNCPDYDICAPAGDFEVFTDERELALTLIRDYVEAGAPFRSRVLF